MDSKIRILRRLAMPSLGRRSFFRLGTAACASLIAGCSPREKLTRSGSPRTLLLKGNREWAPSVCTLCPSGCALRAYLEGGRIVAISGDPEDPNTGGKLCPVGLSMLNYHSNPDRLRSAWRKNDQARLSPVRSEEVIQYLAQKIREGSELHVYGRITPFTSGLSKVTNAACHLDEESARVYGYPALLNTGSRPPVFDFDNSQTAFLFGSNILEHGYPFVGYVRRITEARIRGMQIVTFSPFLTNTATAGEWIAVPSLTAAEIVPLAMASEALKIPELHVSIPIAAADFIRSLDGSKLSEASGISPETIRALTLRFFKAPGPAVSDHPSAAVLLLNVMKGNIGRPGGLFHPGIPRLRPAADVADIGAVLRNPQNIVLIHQSNPAFNRPDLVSVLRSRPRALVVCADAFLTESAALSDFVLPLASPLETLTIMEPLPLARPYLAAAVPADQPLASRTFDDWLALLYAAVRGASDLTPARFSAGMIQDASSLPLTRERAVYPVSSQTITLEANIPFIMTSLEKRIAEIASIPALRSDQYLVAPFEESVHGPWSAPSKWLNEITYSPKVYINPGRAGHMGIKTGDSIRLEWGNGNAANGLAFLFEGVHPEALAVPLHHGHTGFGRVAIGERFTDANDPDMSRIFWGGNHGFNAAGKDNVMVTVEKT